MWICSGVVRGSCRRCWRICAGWESSGRRGRIVEGRWVLIRRANGEGIIWRRGERCGARGGIFSLSFCGRAGGGGGGGCVLISGGSGGVIIWRRGKCGAPGEFFVCVLAAGRMGRGGGAHTFPHA